MTEQPAPPAFALFDTAVGRCVVAWHSSSSASDAALVMIGLPEPTEARTRARVLRRWPAAQEAGPPAQVQAAIDGMTALLDGGPLDLTDVALDMTGIPEFHQQVYAATRGIRPGSTLSYGEVAARVGQADSAQAVGQALGRNPFPIVVPCHRVLAADGSMHGFSASGGVETKRRMLLIEGAPGVAPTLF